MIRQVVVHEVEGRRGPHRPCQSDCISFEVAENMDRRKDTVNVG